MNIINIGLFCSIIAAIILYSYAYVKINGIFSSFMCKLCNVDYGMFETFEDAFGSYYDSAVFAWSMKYIIMLAIMVLTIIALIVLVICQLLGKYTKCQKFWEIIILVYCLINMLFYAYSAFIAKYKINIPDNKIYIYDDEFNKEIKENLYNMYKRKICLIVFSIIAIVGIIAQTTYIINKRNKIMEPQNNQQNYNSENQQENDINNKV